MTFRTETIGDAVLYLGDCREPRRRRGVPSTKCPLKEVVACRACDWTWKPYSGFGHEDCPRCGKTRDVRARQYGKNIPALKEQRPKRRRTATEWERVYRRRAKLLVGRGLLVCVQCKCDRDDLLEINHINGGGGAEFKALGNGFYRAIATMKRGVEDLNLLCRPCNAVHALELKHGPLPFRVVWEPTE